MNKLIPVIKMSKVKHQQLLATENGQLRKLNEIVHKAIEEEKLLSDKLLEFEDRNPPFVSRLADNVAGFGGSWKFIIESVAKAAVWLSLPKEKGRPSLCETLN